MELGGSVDILHVSGCDFNNSNIFVCRSRLADEEQGQQQERKNLGGQQELTQTASVRFLADADASCNLNAAKFRMQQIKPHRGLPATRLLPGFRALGSSL